MDLADPIAVVAPRARGAVLRALVAAAEPISGREIARRAKVSQRGAAGVLADLARHGLVTVELVPPALRYALNDQHVAAGGVRELALLRHRLLERMRTHVESWRIPAESVIVFGSFARGEGDADSDIDVLVVRPERVDLASDDAWGDQIVEFQWAVARWSGNRCEVVELAAAEREPSTGGTESLLKSVARDGIVLAGEPMTASQRLLAS